MAPLTKYEFAKLDEKNIRNDSFISRVFLSYIYPIVARGRAGKLTTEELKMPGDQAAEVCCDKFMAAWEAEILRAKGIDKPPSLMKALISAYGWDIFVAGVWKSVWSVLVLLGAFYFVRSLVQYVSDPIKNPNIYNTNSIEGVGWILSAGFFVDSVLVGTALQRLYDSSARAGIKMRAALMSAVYRKTFKLSSVNNDGAGNVVSLVSTDCFKVYEGVLAFHNIWTAPLETAAIIALLLSLTGVYGLPALGIVLFVLPLQYYFGYKIATYKTASVDVADARVLRMQEILLAIKLVKFYVWEQRFVDSISEVRKEEVHLLQKNALIKVFNLCLVFAVPPLTACAIYATYVFNKGPFDSVFSFTILSLFNTLRFPLVVLPKALHGTSQALAGIKRLETFLLLDETKAEEKSKDVEISFKDCIMSHYKSGDDDFKLKVPKFEVKPGEVAAIVGRVGSGKSSVFTAILQSMRLEKGELKIGGNVAYVPQSPWVQNLTLRENILFGLPYEEARYNQVIHACALELDLKILPNGDQTMAGERGINLSGGQRQRVCLARAAYHPSDLVLLDNPLSAVDQHTAMHIFKHCIQNMLKDKAVVWITHQLEMLPYCATVAIMENGNMTYFGAYDAVVLNTRMPVDHLLFATVEAGESGVEQPEEVKKEEEKKIDLASTSKGSSEANATPQMQDSADEVGKAKKAAGDERKTFQRSTNGDLKPVDSVGGQMQNLARLEEAASDALTVILSPAPSKALSPAASKALTDAHVFGGEKPNVDETPEQIARKFMGTVPLLTPGQAFMVYWKAGGILFGAFSIILFMLSQTTRIFSDLWVRYWAADYYELYPVDDDSLEATHSGSVTYICSYAAFVVFFIILLLGRDFLFSMWHIKASKRLHDILFARVLNAPILFFLRTPVGNVLNCFAKDQDTLDEQLPATAHMSLIYLMILLTSLAIVTVSIHYYAALTAALLLAFVIMQQVYLPAATVLKRWSGDTASHVYVHVDESLHGMDVIKAFDSVNYFIQENVARINAHHLTLFNTEQCHLWLAFWCDFFGAVLVVATCLFSVGLKDDLGSAAVGLAISNTIQVLVFFTWVVRGAADTVSMWDSVERITSFATNIPDESSIISTDIHSSQDLGSIDGGDKTASLVVMVDGGKDDEDWPRTGDLQFIDVCMRYYPGAPLALKYVCFHIKDRQKVGVVGRTGSGKTTLLMALFRMMELAYGEILIDGVRTSVAIIPQEPVMFKGTVRSNLDPFLEKPDAELWTALEMVHMKDSISEMSGGLDCHVAEGGSNFSLGQKQLVCMARCVLKKTRVLVLDEATAAMDLQTDALIQKTIRTVFESRTTITIAHRLDTIIFSDRILAMGSGEVKEFGEPVKLLNKPSSMFNKLVDDTGPHASAMLRRLAAEGPTDD
eukprot:gene17393-23693_t